MELIVYKGFDVSFLNNIHIRPLVISDAHRKKDVFSFDKAYSKQLQIGLLSLEESDTVWATYEELSLISKVIDGFISDGLKNNTMYSGKQMKQMGREIFPFVL